MIKRIKQDNYQYKHPLGSIVVDQVEVGISEQGRRSLPAHEIERLNRLVVLNFLRENYKKSITDEEFTLSTSSVRSIMVFLGVNQTEFGHLIGCQKSKVSKILRSEQQISKPQAQLAIERMAMELARPGATRKLLGDEGVCLGSTDESILKALNEIRYAAA